MLEINKIISIAACLILISAGIIYQNCGSVPENIQSQMESTETDIGIHQKIFIDFEGEKNPNADDTQALNATVIITKITTGYHHSCALRSNGTVKCWGNNDFGQLGNGITGGDFNTPVTVLNL